MFQFVGTFPVVCQQAGSYPALFYHIYGGSARARLAIQPLYERRKLRRMIEVDENVCVCVFDALFV